MLKCCICQEKYDDQFISRYATMEHQKKVIYVCENCYSEIAIYEDETNLLYIRHDNEKFYSMEELV